MAKSYAEWLIRWRYLILIATLILVAAAAGGLQFITFKTDYRVFFSADNPQLLAFEELQNTYTKTDNVMFVLAPKDGQVFNRATLASVERLTEASWQMPWSLRVDSLTNYQHTSADGDDLVVADLAADPQLLEAEDFEAIRDIALHEPLLVHRLISENGQVTAVNVTIQLPDQGTGEEVPEITAFARDLVKEIEAGNPNLDVYLTGMVVMNNSFPEVSIHDQQTLIPIMFGVVLITLVLLLRSFTAMLATFLVIIFSIMTAMGLAGWMGIALTPPSASSPTIILTLAVADCVHILVTLLQGMR
ncbi:MAG: MMPL family transporter, partial [Gammaproteobacteria bacterium]